MRLILVRHGETEHNAGGLALGRADVPLNDRGRLQAQAVAGRLAGEPIAAVYASPLQRAVDTAAPLAQALGLTIEVEPALIEMDVGELDGQDFATLRQRYPEFLKRWLSNDLADAVMPGGESLRQVQDRAWSAIGRLQAQHDGDTVAVVSHNFVVLTLICRAIDLPLSRFRRLRHDLAGISRLEFTPERTLLLALNDTAHLQRDGLSSTSWLPPRT